MALVPPGVVTRTSTVPAPGGAVTVHELEAQDDGTAAGLLAKYTLPPLRLEPSTVILEPPVAGPEAGT